MDTESPSTSRNFIKIHWVVGRFFVWNINDLVKLRSEYRIVGKLVGPSLFNANQIADNGLPLQLLNEEVKLLIDLKVAQIYEYSLCDVENDKKAYEDHRNRVLDEYIELLAEENEKNRLKHGQKMAEKSIPDKDLELFPVEFFTSSPWTKNERNLTDEWKYPESEMEKIKYFIFNDAWHRGLFISCGLKFGCDYLLYENDPITVHASYLLICKKEDEELSALQLLVHGRLSTAVNKHLLLASLPKVDENTRREDIDYVIMKWRGNSDTPSRTLQKKMLKKAIVH